MITAYPLTHVKPFETKSQNYVYLVYSSESTRAKAKRRRPLYSAEPQLILGRFCSITFTSRT